MTFSLSDIHLFKQVKKGDVFAFEKLFKNYYKNLCFFAENYVKEKAMAEEIVESFFITLWEKRNIIEIKGSVKSYFYKGVQNQCIKYLEHLKVMKKYEDFAISMLRYKELLAPSEDAYPLASLISQEIVDEIEKSISDLPEKCREIFCMSRFDQMSYEEIASKLNISINTVRTQMARALQRLRESLKKYLPLFLVMVLYCIKLLYI